MLTDFEAYIILFCDFGNFFFNPKYQAFQKNVYLKFMIYKIQFTKK